MRCLGEACHFAESRDKQGSIKALCKAGKKPERSHETLTATASREPGWVLEFWGDGGSQANKKNNPQPTDVSRLSVSWRHRHKIRTQQKGLPVGGRAGEKENNAPGDSGGSAQGGCQRPEVAESLLLHQPSLQRTTPERASGRAAIARGLESVRCRFPAGTECRWSCTDRSRLHHAAISQANSTGGMEGQSRCSDALAKLPKLADRNESALSAEGCLSRIFGARKNVEFLERARPPAAVQTTLPRR